jgi:hypothetical protein
MSFSYGGGFRGFSTTVFLRVGPVVRCGLPLEPGYRPYSYVVVPVGTKDGMTKARRWAIEHPIRAIAVGVIMWFAIVAVLLWVQETKGISMYAPLGPFHTRQVGYPPLTPLQFNLTGVLWVLVIGGAIVIAGWIWRKVMVRNHQ